MRPGLRDLLQWMTPKVLELLTLTSCEPVLFPGRDGSRRIFYSIGSLSNTRGRLFLSLDWILSMEASRVADAGIRNAAWVSK